MAITAQDRQAEASAAPREASARGDTDRFVADFVEGDLAPALAGGFAAHLESCAACWSGVERRRAALRSDVTAGGPAASNKALNPAQIGPVRPITPHSAALFAPGRCSVTLTL